MEDLQSQVDHMKRLYDKLAMDLNHKPFEELGLKRDQRQRRSVNEVGIIEEDCCLAH